MYRFRYRQYRCYFGVSVSVSVKNGRYFTDTFFNIMLYYLCLQLYQLIIVQSSYLLFNNDEYSIYIIYRRHFRQSVVKMPFHPFYLHFILHNLHNLYIRLFYTHSLHTFFSLCFIHYMCFVCILRLHPCAKRYVLFRAISSSIHYYGIQASL